MTNNKQASNEKYLSLLRLELIKAYELTLLYIVLYMMNPIMISMLLDLSWTNMKMTF